MGLHDPPSEMSARRRQALPLLPGPGSSFDTSSSSDNTSPLNTNPDNSTSASPFPPLQLAPSATPDSLNSTPNAAPAAASLPSTTPTPLPGPPTIGGASGNIMTPSSSKPLIVLTPTPTPSPTLLTPSTTLNSTSPLLPVAPLKNNSSSTPTALAALPTHAATSDSSLNTTPILGDSSPRPVATFHRNVPTSTPAAQADNSGGLSGGAITGIAVVAGIIGFILLFWVGVQLLQSKRRRREEEEMQEIDFYPSGGSSVNGGMAYPGAASNLDRQPSASNSFNYNKSGPAHFGDGMRDEGEFIEPHVKPELDSTLQRQATLGSSSAYSGGYYNNPAPAPPAPYMNYSPYSHQYGVQPTQPAMYEQHPYEYPHGRISPGEYLHGPVQGNPPPSTDYQR